MKSQQHRKLGHELTQSLLPPRASDYDIHNQPNTEGRPAHLTTYQPVEGHPAERKLSIAEEAARTTDGRQVYSLEALKDMLDEIDELIKNVKKTNLRNYLFFTPGKNGKPANVNNNRFLKLNALFASASILFIALAAWMNVDVCNEGDRSCSQIIVIPLTVVSLLSVASIISLLAITHEQDTQFDAYNTAKLMLQDNKRLKLNKWSEQFAPDTVVASTDNSETVEINMSRLRNTIKTFLKEAVRLAKTSPLFIPEPQEGNNNKTIKLLHNPLHRTNR